MVILTHKKCWVCDLEIKDGERKVILKTKRGRIYMHETCAKGVDWITNGFCQPTKLDEDMNTPEP